MQCSVYLTLSVTCLKCFTILLLCLFIEANRQYKLDSGGFDVLSKVDKDAPLQKFLTKRSESSPPPGFKNGTIEVVRSMCHL